VSSNRKTERLLDLLVLLLGAERPLTLAEIREQFPDYRGPNQASGDRAFERDKQELTLLGVPVRCVHRGEEDGLEEDAYVIDRERYLLPPLELEPDEAAALAVSAEAARVQPGFPYAEVLESALHKIAFDGGPPEAFPDLRLDLQVTAASSETPRSLRVLERAVHLRKV
jgi:predicted DNA-binding transcriptional regulator YafY